MTQVSDAAVAFDVRHDVWLISSLGVNCPNTPVFTSRSTDGGLTWSNAFPVIPIASPSTGTTFNLACSSPPAV